VEDRPAATGDTILVDLTRTRRTSLIEMPGEGRPARGGADDKPEKVENASLELGHKANPPGFDEHLTGSSQGDTREFTVTYPADYGTQELAGATVDYSVTIKAIRRKELLPLDDDFAKEVSDQENLEALRTKIREDLQHEAEHEAEHRLRHDLLRDLSTRLKTAPDVLVEQEVDRRLEEFVRRLADQGIDPMKTEIDWQEFRARQRSAAEETVRSTLVLDAIGDREHVEATDEDVEKEIGRYAERAGRTPAAVRARLEKEGALERIRAGIRREKTMALLLEKANVVT
jgi:trigger factor